MTFNTIIDQLILDECSKKQENGTILIGLINNPPPLSNHYIYAPIEKNIEKSFLLQYKKKIPKDLIELYRYCNGFNMFWVKQSISIGKKSLVIPFSHFICYGVPYNADRNPSNLQPIDIRLEDLNRSKGTPNNWLKFGAYTPCDMDASNDLWIDIDTQEIIATNKNSPLPQKKWEKLDDCLCSLYTSLCQ